MPTQSHTVKEQTQKWVWDWDVSRRRTQNHIAAHLAYLYPTGYILTMNTLIRSAVFDTWLTALADLKAKARILAHLRSASLGNFGDCEPVGEGVSEMRIHVGPGYRVYFTRAGTTVYVLLVGGNKATQSQDIARAKTMARALKETK